MLCELKNKTLIHFLIVKLAENYNEIIVKINSSLLLVLCLVYQISIGQTPAERMLRGTIRVDATHASGISILNLSTDKSTTTNQDGEFVNGSNK
jgi:hypothetical protein